MISNDQDLLIYSDATFKASDGKVAFGYVMVLRVVILDADACQGSKAASSKEAETRAILVDLRKGKGKCFNRVHMVSDVKDVVQLLNEDDNWRISPTILDINLFGLFI